MNTGTASLGQKAPSQVPGADQLIAAQAGGQLHQRFQGDLPHSRALLARGARSGLVVELSGSKRGPQNGTLANGSKD